MSSPDRAASRSDYEVQIGCWLQSAGIPILVGVAGGFGGIMSSVREPLKASEVLFSEPLPIPIVPPTLAANDIAAEILHAAGRR